MGHNHETGVQLIPEEGIIMSTGIPEEFCWNDSDENTKKWNTDGDANLTSLLREENPTAVTYDACVIEFDFKCANVSSCQFVCVRPVLALRTKCSCVQISPFRIP